MTKHKITKNLLAFIIIFCGLIAARLVFAQDFGTNAVNNGLANSLSAADPRVLAGRIINIVLGFLGVIAVGLIMYAGFIWTTSNGDEEKVTQAKNILKNSVIGLAIILASWGIAIFILSRLGGAGNGGNGGGCYDGTVASCGCGGSMVCSGGSYGGCVGSDCGGNNGGAPTSCDGNVNLAGCQAVDQICSSSDYCDHTDCGCKPKGKLGDSCNADATKATCQADNNRCAEYLTCSPQTCTCYGPPVITSVSPVGGFCSENPNKSCVQDSDCSSTCNLTIPNGAANNFITISGTNFETYSATSSQVIFEGSGQAVAGLQPAALNSACLNSWTDNQIVIAVPSGVASGPLKVINKDNLSDATNDTVGPAIPNFQVNSITRPGLCNLNPNSGTLSLAVDYSGINLYAGSAYFGNYQNNVQALQSNFTSAAGLTGTSTIPNIKPGESGSFVQKTINGTPEKSNYLVFTKDSEPNSGPFISSFIPSSGTSGQYVTIYGSGFGGARGASHVYFGSTEAAYDFPTVCLNSVWSDSRIVVKVPAGLTDGYYPIKISLGVTTIDTQNLNPNTFQASKNLPLKTSLCKIDPSSGPAQTSVTLWGEYFGNLNSIGLVKFNNDESATGTIQQDGQASKIQTLVPVGAITGPVRVINNSTYGNELNFEVAACASNADCGTQVCCPQNTYKKGLCVNDLSDCLINIPTSIFEWSFSTGFSTGTPNPYGYSCAGLAQYYGACQTGNSCPNVPGTCSPYSGGGLQSVGTCDHSCASVAGCGALAPNNCSYDTSVNSCVKNGTGSNCDLAKILNYTINGHQASTTEVCNQDGNWEANISTACPTSWHKSLTNTCLDSNNTCSICSSNFKCQGLPANPSAGRCVSATVCPTGATCQASTILGGQDQCVVTAPATCACCCPISPDPAAQKINDQQNCCSFTNKETGQTGQLTCQGRCGSDVGKTATATLGKCGGCASAGNTPVEQDAACNCSGHSGQYCDTTNPLFPTGVCTDCSDLKSSDCTDHSSVCCLDAKKTNSAGSNICRGGLAITSGSISSLSDVGYCAYYNCQDSPNNTLCATSTPAKNGAYADQTTCSGECLKANLCSSFTTLSTCQAVAGCCYDAQATGNVKCRSGSQIPATNSNGITNPDQGYCAYYNCQAVPNNNLCATSTPVKVGPLLNTSVDSCIKNCANPPSGPGLSCAGKVPSTCATNICNFPNFNCLSKDGLINVTDADCGTCCCTPGTVDPLLKPGTVDLLHPSWVCVAGKGGCTGTKRGLYCGCQSDSECGSPQTIGCGADTCCESRPQLVSSLPNNLDDKVCRNAVIKVTFDSPMDPSSFASNVLLLEDHQYGNGVCPAGTFITKADEISQILAVKNENWLQRLWGQAASLIARITGHLSDSALAGKPDPSDLYCSIPGTVYGENSGTNGSFTFAPNKLLDPSANYYLVIKGDEDSNSKTGVLSANEIGFEGKGYCNGPLPCAISNIATGTPSFNNENYANSQIIEFNTLSSQGPNAGICAVDNVQVDPSSYLFQTTTNALTSEEDDTDATSSNKTFDTVADRDKVFSADAYSADGEILQPVSGYSWTWNFGLSNNSIAATSTVPNLPANKIFVAAQSGVTDGETKLTAAVKMATSNVITGGDGFNNSSDIYVFVCNNPWPPVGPNGSWSPWVDTCQGAVTGNCTNYNYKFYYCRDAGEAGTQDDLPAIVSQPVIRGGSLICSADNTPCDPSAQDGAPCAKNTGVCVWNILKESYFFRETILSGAQVTQATDQKTGGAVKIVWQSAASQVSAYKIYYLPSGQGTMLSQEIPVVSACTVSGSTNNCNYTITGLTNATPYIFQVSVILVNQTESQLSTGVTATPTDQTPPFSPPEPTAKVVASSTIEFSWTSPSNSFIYRLYHGVQPGQYGESFDSLKSTVSLDLPISHFSNGNNYFALSAIDSYNNESAKSAELSCNINVASSTMACCAAATRKRAANNCYIPKLNCDGYYSDICANGEWTLGTVCNTNACG